VSAARTRAPEMRRRVGPIAARLVLTLLAGALTYSVTRAEWLQPDPTLRDAQYQLRSAMRDTVGHADDPARLDSLGAALLRLARGTDASAMFHRVIALKPGDATALAGLGKLALFENRAADAESLLMAAGNVEEGTLQDLYSARLRLEKWADAAKLAEDVNDAGRAPLLEALAEAPPFKITAAPREMSLMWSRSYPVPLVQVKLNNELVLMALDTGASDLLLDPMWVSRANITRVPGQSLVFWCGSRFATKNAIVQRLEINGVKVERVPAGILSLHKWSIEVNPNGEQVAGVIGLNLLRRFTPTIDFKRQRLELRPLVGGVAAAVGSDAIRVPFELWGESEMMVRGTVAGSRKLAMVVQTGVPGCGLAAPTEVFDELGLKGGAVSKFMKGLGTVLQGRPWVGVTVPSIQVGRMASDHVAGWSNAMDSGEMWRHGVRRDAILAGQFFDDTRMTIDWAKRELVLEQR
jgi:hypothetical protein